MKGRTKEFEDNYSEYVSKYMKILMNEICEDGGAPIDTVNVCSDLLRVFLYSCVKMNFIEREEIDFYMEELSNRIIGEIDESLEGANQIFN